MTSENIGSFRPLPFGKGVVHQLKIVMAAIVVLDPYHLVRV